MMVNFLTGDVWKQVNKLLTQRSKKIACIAYVTSDNLKLKQGDTLICDASTYAIKFNETSPSTLKTHYDRGVKIYWNQQLHAKILLTEKFLVIGSANLSKSSATRLTEASIITNDSGLISQAKAFCYKLTEESTLLTEDRLNELLRIEVIKRPFKPTRASSTRSSSFGNRLWFITARELSERSYNLIKEKVEKDQKVLAKKENVDVDDIGFLRWNIKSAFASKVKEGDQIIMKFGNKEKTRANVDQPTTILKKEVVNGYTFLYYDQRDFEKNKLSWTRFLTLSKNLQLSKQLTNRTKVLSENNTNKLKLLWIKS